MSQAERIHAVRLLCRVFDDHISLMRLFSEEKNMTSWTKAMVLEVCRYSPKLNRILETLVPKTPAPDIRVILLVGLCDLTVFNTPVFAAVNETVNLLKPLKKVWAKGLVNAVLRRFCRDKDSILAELSADPEVQYAHPTWLCEQLKEAWPDHAEKILNANNEHPPMTLRINLNHQTREAYLARLHSLGMVATPCLYAEAGVTLAKPCDVHELPGFAEGDVSVQDEAAQCVAPLLGLSPGLRVLDACAAPGGKTAHLLEMGAEVVALDIDTRRLAYVQDNLQRLKLRATLLAGDATTPENWWDGQRFDRILLDAPCSALGVIRRHPDIKLRRKPESLVVVSALQNKMLHALWPLLNPGGYLVYTTCSVLPAENNDQIAAFVAKTPDCIVKPLTQLPGIATCYGWQNLPGLTSADGFFYAVLEKKVTDEQ